MRTTAERYINATDEAIAGLAKALECTEKAVYNALTYRTDSALARKIRYTAVKEFRAIPMHHCPVCNTIFDITEDGRQIMRQEFDNGATLRIDKKTGESWITNRRGVTVAHRQCISLPQLSEIQVMAENM